MDMQLFKKTVKLVLFNQMVVGLVFCYGVTWAFLKRGNPIGGELPSFPWVMFEILVFSFVEEFFFYYTHRYEFVLFIDTKIRKKQFSVCTLSVCLPVDANFYSI